MGLIRLLIIAAIFWIVFAAIKEWLSPSKQTPRRGAEEIERVVKCAYCGLHVPESEAVRARGHYYCSTAHRDAHAPHG